MKVLNKVFLFLLPVGLLALLSCSPSSSPVQEESPSSRSRDFEFFYVSDSYGNPIAEAHILIGYEEGLEFSGNLITTNREGMAYAPAEWTSPLPISIYKDGYVSKTHLDLIPNSYAFQIQDISTSAPITRSGKVTGFKNIKKDGYLDFGIVIPSFSREDFLNIDLSKMISPELDRISVLGVRFNIPSNIFLPKQSESYFLIPFTLEKAIFKLFFDIEGTYSTSVHRGKFHLKTVSDKLNSGKKYYEVVNDFQFLGMDKHRIQAKKALSQEALELSSDLALDQSFQIPAHIQGSSNRLLFAVSATEMANEFSAMDIKLKDKSQPQLYFAKDSSPQVLFADTAYEEIDSVYGKISESMSTALYPVERLDQAVLIPPTPRPVYQDNALVSELPQVHGGITPHNMKLNLAHIEIQKTDDFYFERKQISWEIESNTWHSNIQLPKIPALNKQNFKRWSIIYFAKEEGSYNATHMVRNALDIN